MAPSELFRKGGNAIIGLETKNWALNGCSKFNRRYKKKIWLNPIDKDSWNYTYGYKTIQAIQRSIPDV